MKQDDDIVTAAVT